MAEPTGFPIDEFAMVAYTASGGGIEPFSCPWDDLPERQQIRWKQLVLLIIRTYTGYVAHT